MQNEPTDEEIQAVYAQALLTGIALLSVTAAVVTWKVIKRFK